MGVMMSKNSEVVYKSYSALVADSVKGGVRFCCCTVEKVMVRCLKEVGNGA